MEYTKLGNTGMEVSRICLGCMGFGDAERWVHQWVLDEEHSRPIIKHALELGINLELTRKNGASEVGDQLIGDWVACSKAIGLTYCNVECKRMGL
jgi:aryl-alcohol dehydrogenase-like predicted oxidoreductase